MPEKKDKQKEGEQQESEWWERPAGIALGFIGAPFILASNWADFQMGMVVNTGSGSGNSKDSFSKGINEGQGAFAGAIAGALAGAVAGSVFFGVGAVPGAIIGAVAGAVGGGTLVNKISSDNQKKGQSESEKQSVARAKASPHKEQEMQRVRQRETGGPRQQTGKAAPLPRGTAEVKFNSGPVSPSSVPSGQSRSRSRSNSQSTKR